MIFFEGQHLKSPQKSRRNCRDGRSKEKWCNRSQKCFNAGKRSNKALNATERLAKKSIHLIC